jgi:hypothetical protein
MTDLRRNIKCSNCGTEAYVQLSSGLDLKELMFAGICSNCGNTIQVNFNIVEKSAEPQKEELPSTSTQTVNLDDTLFKEEKEELPNNALKDLMGD